MEAGRDTQAPEWGLCRGRLEVGIDEMLVLADGRPLPLTARELKLLSAFVARSERVVPRSELYLAVWEAPLRPNDRSVDVYVSRLRAKLAAALPDWLIIHTHFGFGYRFSPQQQGPSDASAQSGVAALSRGSLAENPAGGGARGPGSVRNGLPGGALRAGG